MASNQPTSPPRWTLGRNNKTTAAPSASKSRMHPTWISENLNTVNQQHPPAASSAALCRNLFSPEKKRATPLRASTPQRTYRSTPKRSTTGEYCGLTAEITRELHSRGNNSVKKAPRSVSSNATKQPSMLQTTGLPVSQHGNPSSSGSTQSNGSTESITASVGGMMHTPPRAFNNLNAQSTTATAATTTAAAAASAPVASTSKTKRGISTPIRMKNKIFSAKKVKKCLTPPREGFASHLKQLRSNSGNACSSNNMASASQDSLYSHSGHEDGINIASSPNSTLSTALPGADNFKIHSTEYDPFDFQCELPPKREIISHAKICSVVDSYTSIHLEFNFAMLAGLTRATLVNEYENSSVEKPMIAGCCHRDVVKGVLDCEDDLIVEGFFREYVGDVTNVGNSETKTPAKNAKVQQPPRDDRIEAVIFSSEKLRQIIVCFRGSTASQAKPLKINYFGNKEASSILHQDHQVHTLSAFRDAYFGTPMEETVFALLANLATRKPFFDVVMTGHSFGGALATIAAMRYATAHPMMRVSCHVFGCPRIGGEEWRMLVHSLANLKVFRVENGCDPYVGLPSGSEWVQVGHAICISDAASSSEGNNTNSTQTNGSSSNNVQFTARRFDRDRNTVHQSSSYSSSSSSKFPKVNLPRGMTQGLSTTQGKVDHEMKSYVDKLTNSRDKWFTDFVGMNGNGVISFADNERRLLA